MQGSNGKTDMQNRFMDMWKGEERVRGMKMWYIYTMKYYTSKKWIKLCHFLICRLTYRLSYRAK